MAALFFRLFSVSAGSRINYIQEDSVSSDQVPGFVFALLKGDLAHDVHLGRAPCWASSGHSQVCQSQPVSPAGYEQQGHQRVCNMQHERSCKSKQNGSRARNKHGSEMLLDFQ